MQGISLEKINQQQKPSKTEDKKPKDFFSFLNKDIQLFGNEIGDKVRESFYLEMSMLLSAGIDIRNVLELILSEKQKKNIKSVFEKIKEDIIKGSSLSEALRSSNKFSEYEYFSVQIGEETGKLSEVLKDLSVYYTKKIKQRRQIIAALTYPAIVSSFALIAVLFMLNFVVPMFADVFKRFGGELPGITKFILSLSASVQSGFWYFAFIVLIAITFFISQRRKIWFRSLSGKVLIHTPVIGKLVHKIYLSRFCNSMHLMIASKVSMLRAITLIRQMISFYPIESTLKKVEEDIMHGKSLHESLSLFTIYPQKMTALIKAGEEVNKLDFFFEKLYQQYTDETEYQSAVLGNLLEPFIIIFLGLLVGVILIAMYLPLFQLGQHF
ncbi:MAG: type II secretion system F family protein [Bacteroidetes bacterium]|nr:type II secretion system F family protein [Bacteroidota bacterium]